MCIANNLFIKKGIDIINNEISMNHLAPNLHSYNEENFKTETIHLVQSFHQILRMPI